MKKKATGLSFDELLVAALEEAKNYPLILDNDTLTTLFKNKFVTKTGVQLPPKEFITKVTSYIERNPPQSPQQFDIFVQKTISSMPAQITTKKQSWWHR